MRNIGNQLRFHLLAFYFLSHCVAEALLYQQKLLLKGFKQAQILLYFHIEIPRRYLLYFGQQNEIFFLQPADIKPQPKVQKQRIADCNGNDKHDF